MHPDVNILAAQSYIDERHRAASMGRLRAEARRAAAEKRSAQRSQPQPVAHVSLFRRLIVRIAI